MRTTFRLSKKRVLAVLVVLLLAAATAVSLLLLQNWENRGGDEPSVVTPADSQNRAEIFVNGEKYTVNDQVEAVLFLGIDSYEKSPTNTYINGRQADLLMLLVLNHETSSYTVLHINRDTMTTFRTLGVTGEDGGTTKAQIAMSHAYGTGANDSSRNTTKAVSDLLYGVDIPHFVTIHMDAIPVLNDAVGGVTLTLEEDFTALDPSFVKGQTVTLQGDQATAYVQYRVQLENNTNIDRMDRQRRYLSAWTEQLRLSVANNDKFLSSLALQISDSLISDLSVDQLSKLGDYFSDYTSDGIVAVAGESVQGEAHMEFYVDEDALQQQVLDLFYKRVE